MSRLSFRSSFGKVVLAVSFAALVLADASAATKKKKTDLADNPLKAVKSRQPDKELYDKAMVALKKGRFDVARLDLQTLLNTYPNSEYQMRAKLSVADSWFKEGGTAALTQAEAEYKDFETFFPTAPEAAEAQMKVGDIYYMQMEKPDRDFNNVLKAEQEYRIMINTYPDSSLIPRAKQKLREVQEVLAEREAEIGLYYESRQNWPAGIARLETVSETYPLYSHSDQVLIGIGDAYAGEAKFIQLAPNLPGAVKERLRQMYLDKAAAAYAKVITRYPMAPKVEDARDRLVAMNRPIPEPTPEALAENDAEEKSRQSLRFTDKTLGLIKHGPQVVEAAHVGDPTLVDPTRIYAPEITKENMAFYASAVHGGQPAAPEAPSAAPATANGANEPPRSDAPSTAPLQLEAAPGSGGAALGAEIVSAPSGPVSGPATGAPAPATNSPNDPNAVVKAVGNKQVVLPAAEGPAAAPDQVNDIKTGATPNQPNAAANGKKPKEPKIDQSDESSSKKKKKKGLAKLNPF